MFVYVYSTLYIHLFYFSSFEAEVYNEWVSGVDEVAKTNLEKPLLVWEKKESMELVKVNFDPKVNVIQYTLYMYIHVLCSYTCTCCTCTLTKCIYMYVHVHVHVYVSAHFMYI